MNKNKKQHELIEILQVQCIFKIQYIHKCLIIWFGFIVYQPLWVIQCHIHFYMYKPFHFKQFSLV